MKIVVAEYGQSLIDLALQHYGTADAVLQLMLLNPGLQPGQAVGAGTELVADELPTVAANAQYYAGNGLRPATATEVPTPPEEDNYLITHEGDLLITHELDNLIYNE